MLRMLFSLLLLIVSSRHALALGGLSQGRAQWDGVLTLSGSLNVQVQDNRQRDQDLYEIRIGFDGVSERLTTAISPPVARSIFRL
jgi:hypothetical protein